MAMVLLSKALSRMAKTPITDSTSGFRSAGPRAISLFAEQYPAEYLGDTVGSLAIAIRNDLVIRETPVTMYYRADWTTKQERPVVRSLSRTGGVGAVCHAPAAPQPQQEGCELMTPNILAAFTALILWFSSLTSFDGVC